MYISSQTDSFVAELQIMSLNLYIPKSLRDKFWHEECFNETGIRHAFEYRIAELAKDEPAIFKDEYIRGTAWLSLAFAGRINTELIAEFESIPLFKKYSAEFDTGLTFEDAAFEGFRYFPADQFEMIGAQY